MSKGAVQFGIVLQVAEPHNSFLVRSVSPTRGEEVPMSTLARREILVVDDDTAVRDSIGLVLKMAGYEVSLAENGFDALLQLRRTFPAVIISDLNMPQMSGFEFLSVVRRRFPGIPVIAMSGAYHYGDAVPGGVIADVFYAKGRSNPDELLKAVANLIQTSAARAVAHQKESAPVWIPRNGKDSHGIPYVVLTCTECLRSFPLSVVTETCRKSRRHRACSAPARSAILLIFLFPLFRHGLKGKFPQLF